MKATEWLEKQHKSVHGPFAEPKQRGGVLGEQMESGAPTNAARNVAARSARAGRSNEVRSRTHRGNS